MTDLSKKDAKLNFDDKCEIASLELKRILWSSPVLTIYNRKLETELHTDAIYYYSYKVSRTHYKIAIDCSALTMILQKKSYHQE